MQNLEFILVKTDADKARLKEFALSFRHKLHDADFEEPILAVQKDGQLVGYVQMTMAPVHFFAFHPGKSNPAITIETMKRVLGHGQVSGALEDRPPGYVTVPLGEANFTPHLLEKLGMIRRNMEIYAAPCPTKIEGT